MDKQGRILVVDDVKANRLIISKILGKSYHLEMAESADECLAKLAKFGPDLILLDIMMPGMDGYEACHRIKSGPFGPFTQVVLVSGKASTAERLKGYEAQADDYIVKPFDHDELAAKVRIQFRLREANLQLWTLTDKLQGKNDDLERLVEERAREIVATRDLTVFSLAQLADSRDPETGEHLARIRTYSQTLAEELRRLGAYSAELDDAFPGKPVSRQPAT